MITVLDETAIWRIPALAIDDCLTEMSRDGINGNEGIVLWLGRDTDNVAEITHLIRLCGPQVDKRPDLISIHPSIFNDVADIAISESVRLVGQVHSHGPGYCLDLSDTDRAYGIKVPSYLSLVAPDYGQTREPIHRWGIHVFMAGIGYQRLSQPEARRRLTIVGGHRLPILTVGDDKWI